MGDQQVRITLEDALSLNRVELCYPVNQTTYQSRRYHLKEAIVIGLRRLVDQAVEQKLINVMPSEPHGGSTTSNTLRAGQSRTGVTTALDI